MKMDNTMDQNSNKMDELEQNKEKDKKEELI